MSAEQMVKSWPELTDDVRCWAEALLCPCTTTWFGTGWIPDGEKVGKKVMGELLIDQYGAKCGHRCNNHGTGPLGLCGFHWGFYSMDVFEVDDARRNPSRPQDPHGDEVEPEGLRLQAA